MTQTHITGKMYLRCIYMEEIILNGILAFDWDRANSTKSWMKHRVKAQEQEQAFLAKERILIEDKEHSHLEKRFLLYSKTKKGRKLIIAFTIRTVDKQQKIRPISARSMNRKEVKLYEKTIKMA